jgi:hypothetical protein
VFKLNNNMKKILVLAAVLMGLAACNTTADVPHLTVELPKSLKNNKEFKEFVLQAQNDANSLAAACVQKHAEALPFLDVDFDNLDPKQQEALVKLDYEYVEMWYTFNVKFTGHAIKMMHYMQDRSREPEQVADMAKAIAQINKFVQELKDTYGEDLKLDPYPAPVEETPNTP